KAAGLQCPDPLQALRVLGPIPRVAAPHEGRRQYAARDVVTDSACRQARFPGEIGQTLSIFATLLGHPSSPLGMLERYHGHLTVSSGALLGYWFGLML